MKLHIDPIRLEQMFFYDIMLLYNAYVDYVEEENEEHRKQESQYEEDYQNKADEYKNFNIPDIKMPSGGNFDSITRGMLPSGFDNI